MSKIKRIKNYNNKYFINKNIFTAFTSEIEISEKPEKILFSIFQNWTFIFVQKKQSDRLIYFFIYSIY